MLFVLQGWIIDIDYNPSAATAKDSFRNYSHAASVVISTFNKINLDDLWLAFGIGSNFKYIPIHEVVANIDPRICATLPMFHAFIKCNIVSAR